MTTARQNCFSGRAFTVVELLVVIALNAILASLMLASLARAKDQARSVVCKNNLHQLGLRYRMYVDDTPLSRNHPGALPNYELWVFTMVPWPYLTYGPGGVGQNTLFCPVAPLGWRGRAGTLGTVSSAWGYALPADQKDLWALSSYLSTNSRAVNHLICGSYAWNLHLSPDYDPYHYTSESEIRNPPATPLFCDSLSPTTFPRERDHPARDLMYGVSDKSEPPDGEMWRVTIPRHGSRPWSVPENLPRGSPLPGAINVAFYDAHVETVPLERLWTLEWHKNWQAPAQRPP